MKFTLLAESEILEETTERTNFVIEYFQNLNWQEIALALLLIFLQILFAVIVFGIVKWLGTKLINRSFAGSSFAKGQSPSRRKTLKRLANSVFNGVILFLFVFTVLEILGVPIGSLLAGAGVIGLALSLGAQDFVSDLVNGLVILFEKQIDIGDKVIINDILGFVEDTNLKTTVVKDLDGAFHYIPNRKIDIISNHSRDNMRAMIIIRLFANSDFETIDRVVRETTYKKMEDYTTLVSQPEFIYEAAENGQVTLRIPIFTVPGEEYDVMVEFYEALLKALNKAGIALPSNTIDIPSPDQN